MYVGKRHIDAVRRMKKLGEHITWKPKIENIKKNEAKIIIMTNPT